MQRLTRSLLAVLAIACAVAWSAPAAAQDRAPRPFHVAIPEDYPAFDPTLERPAGAAEIAVIAIWRPPAGDQESLVLLNPRHATPEALHLGLLQLEAAARHDATDGHKPFSAASVGDVPPQVRGQLSGILARVREAEPESLRYASRSRFVRLDDLPPYLRTEIIRTRGNPGGTP